MTALIVGTLAIFSLAMSVAIFAAFAMNDREARQADDLIEAEIAGR